MRGGSFTGKAIFQDTTAREEDPAEDGAETKKPSGYQGRGAGRGMASVRNRPWFISALAIRSFLRSNKEGHVSKLLW